MKTTINRLTCIIRSMMAICILQKPLMVDRTIFDVFNIGSIAPQVATNSITNFSMVFWDLKHYKSTLVIKLNNGSFYKILWFYSYNILLFIRNITKYQSKVFIKQISTCVSFCLYCMHLQYKL